MVTPKDWRKIANYLSLAKPPIPLLKNWQKIANYLVCAEIANISSKNFKIFILKF